MQKASLSWLDRKRVVGGKRPALSLLQALLGGVAPESVTRCETDICDAAAREVNDWPQWKKDASGTLPVTRK
jgi:hypothetical protein